MRLFAYVLILLILISGTIVITVYWSRESQRVERHRKVAPDRMAFRSWSSREQYIQHLERTADPLDPDLWRRIEAVKRKPTWGD